MTEKTYSGENRICETWGQRDEVLARTVAKARRMWEIHVEETVMDNVRGIAKGEGLLPGTYSVFDANPGTDGARLMETLWELGLHPDSRKSNEAKE